MICRLREFIANLYRFKPPPYEPLTGLPVYLGPLWDPIRG